MIPKIIHYCWYGNNQKNELIQRCMDTWVKILPDYEFKEWNELNSPTGIPYMKAALDKGLWSKASNFTRLWAIYYEGGLYLDTDFEILKSLDDFLKHECFVSFCRIEERPGWLNNSLMGAHKGNAFIKRCMNKTLDIYSEQNEFIISSRMTTIVLKEMGLKEYGYQVIDDVTIYPVEYFYPYSWVEEFDPKCITEQTHAIHHWNKSWVK